MGRKPLSVRPTKMYLFMSEIWKIKKLIKITGKGVSESLRIATDAYIEAKEPRND